MKSMGSSFGALAIVPLTAIISFVLGMYVVTNHLDADLISRCATLIMAVWVAMTFLETLIGAIAAAVNWSPDETAHTNVHVYTDSGLDTPRKTVHYLVSDGEVVEQLKTRRGYFDDVSSPRSNAQRHNFLVRLGLAKRLVAVPPRAPLPGLEELDGGSAAKADAKKKHFRDMTPEEREIAYKEMNERVNRIVKTVMSGVGDPFLICDQERAATVPPGPLQPHQ